MASYLPSAWLRIRELVVAVRHVWDPPPLQSCLDPDRDVVIVLDPIEAYRSLHTERSISAIRRTVRQALDADVPVLLTRWVRCDASRGDAVDAKLHWSNYVPKEQCDVLAELSDLDVSVYDVVHTNAFTNEELSERVLHSGMRRRALLVGAWTESCVYATAHACLERNIAPVLVQNACVGHAWVAWASLVGFQTVMGTTCRI